MAVIKDKSQKGTLPEKELSALLGFIKNNYWKDAFEELDLPVLKNKKFWFLSPQRADYYVNLSGTKKDTVLDIGAGAGAISETLSKSFKRVFALEYN